VAQPENSDIRPNSITQQKGSFNENDTYHSSFVVDTSHVNPSLKSNRWWIFRI